MAKKETPKYVQAGKTSINVKAAKDLGKENFIKSYKNKEKGESHWKAVQSA